LAGVSPSQHRANQINLGLKLAKSPQDLLVQINLFQEKATTIRIIKGGGLLLQQIMRHVQHLTGTLILVCPQNMVTSHINPQGLQAASQMLNAGLI
jgi:hypothetical protein